MRRNSHTALFAVFKSDRLAAKFARRIIHLEVSYLQIIPIIISVILNIAGIRVFFDYFAAISGITVLLGGILSSGSPPFSKRTVTRLFLIRPFVVRFDATG